ncbi:MAG: flagellar hook-length control protein FliK [Oscillospiraceae bacterium]|jgi:flagellar hook-length control protein FliK|nr:flagellar hook-length control protein FliK [Oscillospiraceae bacterium]
MLISTEMLTQMRSGTGPGADVRQKTDYDSKSGFRFEKVFEEARTETKPPAAFHKDSGAKIKEETVSGKRGEHDEDEDDANITAGTMGKQSTVVFILEGDKESDNDPETPIDGIARPGVNLDGDAFRQATAVQPAPVADESAVADKKIDRTAAIGATDAKGAATAAVTNKGDAGAPNDAGRVEIESIAALPATEPGYVETAETETGGAFGEVMARMPIIRTSEQSDTENEANDKDFSENGGLSPLENENDNAAVKGRKERISHKTEGIATDTAKSSEAAPADFAAAQIPDDIKPQRFLADQNMNRANGTPVRTENLFDEIVSRIEMSKTESLRSMTIQLKPEFLGKVALEIAMDGAGLHLKISAADQNVRSMVNGQIDALIETLQDKGIKVVEVEVAYTGVDNGADADTGREQSRPDSPRRPHFTDAAVDEPIYFSALPFDALEYYLDDSVSSVEYSA